MYHEAELIVLDSVKFLFMDRIGCSVVDIGCFGLVRLLKYFLKVINTHSSSLSVNLKIENNGSQKMHSPGYSADHVITTAETLHLSFSLSMIHFILLTGSCNDAKNFHLSFVR